MFSSDNVFFFHTSLCVISEAWKEDGDQIVWHTITKETVASYS